ncbi:MAG: hypothetical protein WAM94_18205 [Chromatiaceae bacterium]
MKRFIRALSTIPRRVWWIVGGPIAFIALFALDRHFAAPALLAWMVYLWWTLSRNRAQDKAAERDGSEDAFINPATGLPIERGFILDSAGYAYGDGPDQHLG